MIINQITEKPSQKKLSFEEIQKEEGIYSVAPELYVDQRDVRLIVLKHVFIGEKTTLVLFYFGILASDA